VCECCDQYKRNMIRLDLILGCFVGLVLAWTIYFEYIATTGKFGESHGEGESPFYPASPCNLADPNNPGCLEMLTCWKAKWAVTWRRQFIYGFFAAIFMTLLFALFMYRSCETPVSLLTIFFVSWFVSFMGQRVTVFLQGSHSTENEICKFFTNKILPSYTSTSSAGTSGTTSSTSSSAGTNRMP
jgi:hypothetical protein